MFWSRLAPAITHSTPWPRNATPATSVNAFRITIVSYIGSIDGPLAILHSRPLAGGLRTPGGGDCLLSRCAAGRAAIFARGEPDCLPPRFAGPLRRGGGVFSSRPQFGPRQRGGALQPRLYARQAQPFRAGDR